MELVGLFFTALLVGFSGAMMPGPLLTVTIDQSVRKGFKSGPLIVLGHGILELSLVIGLIFGLKSFFNNSAVTGTIGIIGGAVLIWMGYGMVKSALKGQISLDAGDVGIKSGFGPVITGVVTSISNPYWSLWWATVGAGYLFFAWKYGLLGLVLFFSGHIISDLAWYSFISFAVFKGRKIMSDRGYRNIIAVCGIFLLGIAFYFIYSGLKIFLKL